ncbi:MAG: hypothetical protein AABZ31_06910 [Bdellovibrionota bacterium]
MNISAKNITVKKLVWSLIGTAEGLYLIAQNPNPVAVVTGVLLCSVSTLIIADAIRESALENATSDVFNFINEQKRRFSALYAIYKMAPDIAAARENFLLNASQANAVLPAPLADTVNEERTQMWKSAASEAAVSSAATKVKAKVKAKDVTHERIEWMSYAEAGLKNLKMGLLTSDIYSRIENENTLIVTDVGQSEVGAKQMRDYAKNKLSLSFWIAKKTIGGSDLLVISRDTLTQESELVPKVLKRLAGEYSKVLVFVHSDVEQNIKGNLVPPSEQIINSNSVILE